MKKAIIILTFCMSALLLQAQTNVDSLINLLSAENNSTSKIIELTKTISEIYLDIDIEKSIQYAKKGANIAEKDNDNLNLSKLFQTLSMAYEGKGCFDTAQIYIEKSLQTAINSKDKKREINVLFGMGSLYLCQENFFSAIELYMSSLRMSDSINYTDIHGLIFSNLAAIHFKLKNFERTLFYLNQALDIAERIDDNYAKMGIYQTLGSYYSNNNEFSKALNYSQKAYELSVFLNDREYQALSLSSISALNLKFFEYEKGLQNAYEALQISQELGLKNQIIISYNVIADLYREKQMYKESEEMALKGWELDSTSQEATNFALNLTMAYINLGKKNNAVDFFWKYYNLKDQLTERDSYNALIEMEIKYETEKKVMRIATLEKEKLFYIVLGSTGVALLLLAFSVLYYRHRLIIQKRRVAEQQKKLVEKQMVVAEQQREIAEQKNALSEQKIKQLEKEKQLIAAQAVLDGEAAERSRLAKDLHNRLGGALSFIIFNLKEINSSSMEKQDVDSYNNALELLDQSVIELRRIAHHLMPDTLIRYGLRVSIEDFCKTINIVNFQYYGNDNRMEKRLEIILYHSAYELVNNAVKYSEATAINVQLLIDNELASLAVQDNGKGFDPNIITSGTGLDNIQAHVLSYNGKMTILSSPGNGTEISIEFENIKPS